MRLCNQQHAVLECVTFDLTGAGSCVLTCPVLRGTLINVDAVKLALFGCAGCLCTSWGSCE
jgi:hypothetical protein